MPDRRNKIRDLCSDIVELFWKESDGTLRNAKGVLEDISPAGACVQTESEVAAGAEMVLCFGDEDFDGKVRYCTLIGGGYFVGVQFQEGNGWTEGLAEPQYLLKLPRNLPALGIN